MNEPAPAEPPQRHTHLRIIPRFAVVRGYHDQGGPIAVYGVYNTEAYAKKIVGELVELGIGVTDRMDVVPFYEVTP